MSRDVKLAVRVTADGAAAIDRLAELAGLVKKNGTPARSEMARRMLAYASAHMPRGWKP